jgi:beta-phosphoglucomutase family hydrolase
MQISRTRFDAVLFDLDGVITATAKVHAAAWKRMFDEFLESHARINSIPFVPFDIGQDYESYVDGLPRYDGVQRFLASRNIDLPRGDASDPADRQTVCGLGNRKNDFIADVLSTQGVEVYDGTISLIKQLKAEGFKTAVVSSSENAATILATAGIADLFDLRVDGKVAIELQLPGKPAPDTFLEASRRLGVPPERAVVVEDAISGVQAGRDGGFGLVIGVDRKQGRQALSEHGADVVVLDLSEVLV